MSMQIVERLEKEEISLAPFAKRVLAYSVDELIVTFLFLIIYWDAFLSITTYDEARNLTLNFFWQIITLKVVYHAFFVWYYGASPGQMIAKTMCLNVDVLDRPNLTSSITRAVFRAVSEACFYLGFAWAFAKLIGNRQENTTWAEEWILQWKPETEIEIVETILKGDTIEFATAFELMQRIEGAKTLSEMAEIVKDAFYCGMPKALEKAFQALQNFITGDVPIDEIAKTMSTLSLMLHYGDIRKLDTKVLIPILEQLFLRVCLILPSESFCDNNAAVELAKSIIIMHTVVENHDFLDRERWYSLLLEISKRDDLNTKISGLAMAILLEAGKIDNEVLGKEVEKRLSKGVPADLGATWFEGLSMKNHYTLIARLGLWEKLQNYISNLDEEEFKRALLFLRRAFADFTSNEKHDIAENIAEIWGLNKYEVSAVVNKDLEKDEKEIVSKLEEFDFDDI